MDYVLHVLMLMVSFPRLAGSALANTRLKHKGFRSVVRVVVQIELYLVFIDNKLHIHS